MHRRVTARPMRVCRYCGSKASLTIDHVVPLSKGGKWVWENLVTACCRCNGKKGSKSLKQLGWKLKTKPKVGMWRLPTACMHALPGRRRAALEAVRTGA